MKDNKKFWGKFCYVTGTGCLVITFGWWFVDLFKLFSEFYKHSGFDLLLLPLFKLFINPFLWASIILFKLTNRFSPDDELDDQHH